MADKFVTLPEIRKFAQKVLPRDAWNFGDGGAESETTRRRNRRAIDRLAIRQDILVDVREIDRGAALGDTLQFLSWPAGWPVDDFRKGNGGRKMYHLYHHGDRTWA